MSHGPTRDFILVFYFEKKTRVHTQIPQKKEKENLDNTRIKGSRPPVKPNVSHAEKTIGISYSQCMRSELEEY